MLGPPRPDCRRGDDSLAIVGFLIGLSMTSRDRDTADVIYQVVTLPVLVAVVVALLRTPSKDLGPGGPRSCLIGEQDRGRGDVRPNRPRRAWYRFLGSRL